MTFRNDSMESPWRVGRRFERRRGVSIHGGSPKMDELFHGNSMKLPIQMDVFFGIITSNYYKYLYFRTPPFLQPRSMVGLHPASGDAGGSLGDVGGVYHSAAAGEYQQRHGAAAAASSDTVMTR